MTLTTLTLAAHLLTGEVSFYAPDVMEAVYANRLAWGHVAPCPECIGLLAVADRALVGRHAWLQRPGRAVEGPYLIADCGPFLTPGRIAEVDHVTARRWRMAGPLAGVTLHLDRPALTRTPRGARSPL